MAAHIKHSADNVAFLIFRSGSEAVFRNVKQKR
ncbi:hypothetical protein AVEN_248809-1, partial [Araneus ventricosus]